MIKPEKLRHLLNQAVPWFKANPERLQLFYANGKILSTAASSLSYQYHYELEIVVEDFPHHPDLLFVPLIAFLREQQPELLLNPDKQQIQFEADPNNNATFDILIKVPLSERVVVQQSGNQYQIDHPEEPQPTEWQPIERLQLYLKNQLVFDSQQ